MAFSIIRSFNVTIPAGTAKTAPLVTLAQSAPSVVDRIDWLFPAGCNGQVGIQIGARTVPLVPADPTQFFTGSGNSTGYDLTGMHDTGDWSVIGYNTGAFPHTIQVTFRQHRKVKPEPLFFITDPLPGLIGMGES